jgi:hypothetical protein
VGPVVAIVNFVVAEPFDARLTDCGLRAQVGASGDFGETVHDRDTGPANPYIPVKVRVKSAELPAFNVVFPAAMSRAKSGALTCCTKSEEEWELKFTSPL